MRACTKVRVNILFVLSVMDEDGVEIEIGPDMGIVCCYNFANSMWSLLHLIEVGEVERIGLISSLLIS